jgi:hypothetical protein
MVSYGHDLHFGYLREVVREHRAEGKANDAGAQLFRH